MFPLLEALEAKDLKKLHVDNKDSDQTVYAQDAHVIRQVFFYLGMYLHWGILSILSSFFSKFSMVC